jgi:hypothetical protein
MAFDVSPALTRDSAHFSWTDAESGNFFASFSKYTSLLLLSAVAGSRLLSLQDVDNKRLKISVNMKI